MPGSFENAEIYKIVSTENDNEIYIGSTIQGLDIRFRDHQRKYKGWRQGKIIKYSFVSSYILFEKYDIDTCKIILIEKYPCRSREELEKREGYYMEINASVCINLSFPHVDLKIRIDHIEDWLKKYKYILDGEDYYVNIYLDKCKNNNIDVDDERLQKNRAKNWIKKYEADIIESKKKK